MWAFQIPSNNLPRHSTKSAGPELSCEKGQNMSHHDRDAEIAAFIRTKGVTRCPTACSVPTQGSPDLADQAALEQYALARDELARSKIGARWQVFGSLRFRD
jgi:hypothetical protein